MGWWNLTNKSEYSLTWKVKRTFTLIYSCLTLIYKWTFFGPETWIPILELHKAISFEQFENWHISEFLHYMKQKDLTKYLKLIHTCKDVFQYLETGGWATGRWWRLRSGSTTPSSSTSANPCRTSERNPSAAFSWVRNLRIFKKKSPKYLEEIRKNLLQSLSSESVSSRLINWV